MKKIFTFIFCAVLAISSWGTEYQIGSDDYDASTGPTDVYNNYFVSQILYLQSSIIATGAEAGNITNISFWVKSGVALTRKFEVYISASNATQLTGFTSQSVNDKLFDGNVDVPASGWYTIALTKSFTWDGISNLLITINDKANNWKSSNTKHYGMHSGYSGKNQIAYASKNSEPAYDATNLTEGATLSKYYPTIKFNIEASPIGPTYDKPTNVSVTATTSSTATISWTKKDDAKIKLQYSPKAEDDWKTVNDIDAASYTITGLSAETEYEYNVSAVYDGGESGEVYDFFTTASVGHEHDGIAFLGWEETTALPIQAGSYFLKNDVTVSKWTLPSGNTKICLNGKTITITGTGSFDCITVGSGTSLSIYDNEGGGKITAGLNFAATIKVNGGTLSLYGGTIENTANGSDAFAVNVASGAFNIKGNVQMSTSAANINLASSKVITLTGALTNITKLSVNKTANQDITSGWSTYMGSASPADFFSSANEAAPAVILVDGEAQLGVPAFTFSETGEYTTSYPSGVTNVNLVRTFQGGILNTISLPFALTDAQMKGAFGEDYELYQLSSSALSNNVLEVYFDKVSSLALGYPYLLRVSEDVVNPSFSSVTLNTASHRVQTDAIDMVSVVKAQDVTGSDYNLFLNAAGELNWSTQTAQFKGMRAYFQVKEGYRSAVAERRLVIRNTPTDLKSIADKPKVEKTFEKGHLFILKNGKKHTMQGQIIK